MQSDYSKPLAERFGYTNVIQGLWRVAADEGPRYLFRGLGTTIFRALLTNIGQLASYVLGLILARRPFLTTTSYDIFKENLLRYDIVGDNPACHFLASFGAGTFATTISQPADVVRSRLMATHGGNVRNLLSLIRGPNRNG
jgi:dicarboxylate transporter 10